MNNIKGFLVLLNYPIEESRYDGIAKYPAWPLSTCTSKHAIILSNAQFNEWLDSPKSNLMITENCELIMRYVKQCHIEQIDFQLLWLSTCAETPVMPTMSTNYFFEFMGWDYLASLDASYLFDDGEMFFTMYPEELQGVRHRMTKYGLFASKEDALLYSNVRKKANIGTDRIEQLNDEYFVSVFRLSNDSI